MTFKRISTGRSGEETAVQYIKKKGMRVLERNFRCRLGELDIIARDCHCLVFVEVRTVTGTAFGTPQESVGWKKIQKLRLLAQYYTKLRNLGDVPLRFDVVAVTREPGGRVTKVEHIVNAF
ncbi:MAG: YraN family protein [Bacillota bacterium]